MRLNPRAEGPARELFGFAIRAEMDAFDRKLKSFRDDTTLQEALALAVAVSRYVVMDSVGGRKPTDAELRDVASMLASIQEGYTLTAAEVHDYLAKAVLGEQTLADALPEGTAVTLPFVVAGNLLGANAKVEDGQQWWDYLEAIEQSIEAAPDPA